MVIIIIALFTVSEKQAKRDVYRLFLSLYQHDADYIAWSHSVLPGHYQVTTYNLYIRNK